MITNLEVYNRAVNLIDDPDISRAYYSNPVKFQKIMYPFLLNGISTITAPTGVCALLAAREDPVGTTEVFEGTGATEYALSTTPPDGAEFACYIGNKYDSNAQYITENNSVVFSRPVEVGESCSVEWYTAGEFTGDFSQVNGRLPLSSLVDRVVDLLARATVISWASKEKNFLLDIRNLLTDTDFKLHASSSVLKSKISWLEDLRFEFYNLQNKLDWDLRNQNRSWYGY